MSRLQSFILTTTFLVCLAVGLWASQRSVTVKSTLATFPIVANDAGPPIDAEETVVIPAVANEPSVSPRRLTDEDALPAADHPVRRAIDRLMPKASAEERQIWFEEFRDLPVTAVEDLLRLRKESNDTSALQNFPDVLRSETIPNSSSVSPALQRYKTLLQQNLLNVDTPGYRSLCAEWVALPIDVTKSSDHRPVDARQLTAVRLDLQAGKIEITGRPLDVSITGPGWYVVEDESGKPAYTRHGALQINEKCELTLPASPERRPLVPRIVIPENIVQILIDPHGVVYGASEPDQFDTVQPLGQILLARFFDESALTLHRDGLYRPTPAAGSMSRFAAGKQPQVLQAGALERSNVNREATEQALKWIEGWIANRP